MSKENIYENLSKNIGLEKFKNREKKIQKRKNIIQIACSFVICAVSVTSIVYAKNISEKIIYANEYFTGNGVGKAIAEGYIEEPDNKEDKTVTKAKDTYSGEVYDEVGAKIKVKDFLMDDFNLSITFEIEFDDDVNKIIAVNDIQRMSLSDLVIKDENNNIVFSSFYGDRLKEYLRENNMDLDYENTKDYILVNTGVDLFIKDKDGNKLSLVYAIYSDGEFPKSKELHLACTEINVTKEDGVFPGQGETTFTSKWNIDLDVPEKMYGRKDVIYKPITNNKDFTISKATLYDTGFKIEGKYDTHNKYPESPTMEELEFIRSLPEDNPYKKDSDLFNYYYNKLAQTEEYKEYRKAVKEITDVEFYLTDIDGNKISQTEGPNPNGGHGMGEDGIMTFGAMYDVTKSDNEDILIFHFIYQGKEEQIRLKREVD